MNHFYGWKPDKPDIRDLIFSPTVTKLPTKVDLRPECPPIYDQGQLGSCTANAVSGHLDFNRKKQGEAFFFPSRLFVYYQERLLEGSVETDSGASIRDSVKVVKNYGAPPESVWPYNVGMFATEPSTEAYDDAVKYEALQYLRITRSEASMEACLAEGFPFVAGISVYDSFESDSVAKTGKVPIPKKTESLLGGHAIMIVGYTSTEWIFRNSWGDWGAKGYGYLPKSYLLNSGLSSDFWSLRKVL